MPVCFVASAHARSVWCWAADSRCWRWWQRRSVAASRGDGSGAFSVSGALLFPGLESLAARILLSLVDGLVVGYVAGNGLARLRNAIVAAYLRVVWSRYQHHVANDLLDKL